MTWSDLGADLSASHACPACTTGQSCPCHDWASYPHRAAALAARLDLTTDRRTHTLAVGRRAAWLTAGQNPYRQMRAQVAGTLHDVGYAAPVTGMHAIDGAAWLHAQHMPTWLVAAVAHHSTARWECNALGLDNPWPEPEQWLADLLWVADFTTTPTGHTTTLQARCDEIRSRYPTGSAVITALDASQPAMHDAAGRLASWSTTWATRD